MMSLGTTARFTASLEGADKDRPGEFFTNRHAATRGAHKVIRAEPRNLHLLTNKQPHALEAVAGWPSIDSHDPGGDATWFV